ncbi:unnamed protein product, partial [Rotaria socialis]
RQVQQVPQLPQLRPQRRHQQQRRPQRRPPQQQLPPQRQQQQQQLLRRLLQLPRQQQPPPQKTARKKIEFVLLVDAQMVVHPDENDVYLYGVTCTPSCLNGGTCIAMNTCQCVTNVWTGPYCQTPMRILWAFDNNLDDLYNNFPGVGSNGPTYSSPGITGYGTCLYLTAASSQSVTVLTPPFLNMALTSFSLLAWVKATSLHNTATGPYSDNAIFGQCQ